MKKIIKNKKINLFNVLVFIFVLIYVIFGTDVIKDISNKLDDCLFAYFNTFKHYIDLFWECGSIVGPGRGSATGFLSNYLLGITQLDPIRWDIKYWRFLNKERAELPSLLLILGSCKKRTLTIA